MYTSGGVLIGEEDRPDSVCDKVIKIPYITMMKLDLQW